MLWADGTEQMVGMFLGYGEGPYTLSQKAEIGRCVEDAERTILPMPVPAEQWFMSKVGDPGDFLYNEADFVGPNHVVGEGG
jgi:hypothetical protein